MEHIKASEISDILLGQLKEIDTSVGFEEVGRVLQVSDGVARIYGLSNAEAGELLEFDSGVRAVVMNLEEDNVGAVLLGPTDQVKEGMKVRRLSMIVSVPVCEEMVGRVVNPLGDAACKKSKADRPGGLSQYQLCALSVYGAAVSFPRRRCCASSAAQPPAAAF